MWSHFLSGNQGFLWSLHDKHQFLEVRGNGTEIYYSGRDHQIVDEQNLGPIVRADRPIPKQGQFYFEVSIVNTGRNKEIAVGICDRSTPLDRFPGWTPFSFGYHGDDGNIFCESDEDPKYWPEKPIKTGEPIGVFLDFNTATLTFSRKEKELQRVQLGTHHMDKDYFPCVGISSPGAIVRLTTPIGSGMFILYFCFISIFKPNFQLRLSISQENGENREFFPNFPIFLIHKTMNFCQNSFDEYDFIFI